MNIDWVLVALVVAVIALLVAGVVAVGVENYLDSRKPEEKE